MTLLARYQGYQEVFRLTEDFGNSQKYKCNTWVEHGLSQYIPIGSNMNIPITRKRHGFGFHQDCKNKKSATTQVSLRQGVAPCQYYHRN